MVNEPPALRFKAARFRLPTRILRIARGLNKALRVQSSRSCILYIGDSKAQEAY